MPIVLAGSLVETERPRLDVLARIRLLALRRRVFFKVLNRVERALFYLATKVVIKVRSKVLADALNSIVDKLLNAMESTVSRQMKQIGAPLAEKISRIAQKWGNVNASEWAHDRGFIQYLAITWVDHVFKNHTGDR
jgi:hypothetical protein